jgi:nucleotide-binding universal stress UspA family protein
MPNAALSVDTQIKAVLVTTDFSKASDKPLWRALAIARHYDAKFYFAHVVTSVGYAIAGPPALQLATEAATRDIQELERRLLESGCLNGLSHEFIVREGGEIWKQLESVINEKRVDLVVVGTHGRRSVGKMLLGSVAEQIFRRANCLVLTVGPGCFGDSALEDDRPFRSFLFATDFGECSLRALPRAISFANHFGAKLILLHVASVAPIPEGLHWSSTTTDIRKMQEDAGRPALQRLKELASQNMGLNAPPEFIVKFGRASEMILQVARAREADLIILGLHRSRHVDTAAHMPWATAYEVVCQAPCPVLTARS